MRIKKILLWSVAVLVAVVAAAFAWLYFRYTAPASLPAHIPSAAHTVYYLNTRVALKNALEGNKDTTWRQVKHRYQDYFRHLPDPQQWGIDLLGDMAWVGYKEAHYLLFLLNDEQAFARGISGADKGIFSEITAIGDHKHAFSLRDSFHLVWTGQLLAVFPKKYGSAAADEAYLREVLEVQEKDNFAGNAFFPATKKDDALLWFYQREADLRISVVSSLKGYVNRDTAFTVYATDDIQGPYGAVAFPEPLPIAVNTIYADSTNGFVNKTLADLATLLMPGEQRRIAQLPLQTCRKILVLRGPQLVANTSITYAFDDNFNKKQITTTTYDTVQSAVLGTGCRNGSPVFVSNTPGFTFAFDTVPARIKLLAVIDQQFTRYFYPVPGDFQLRFLHQTTGGHQHYCLYAYLPGLPGLLSGLQGKSATLLP